MLQTLRRHQWFCHLSIFAFFVVCLDAFGKSSFSIPTSDDLKGQGVKEFAAPNPDALPTISIGLWGRIGNSGLYYLPQKTTLREFASWVGGPQIDPKDTKITISRITSKLVEGKERRVALKYRLTAEDILTSVAWSEYQLEQDDVLYVEGVAEERGPSFFEVLKDTLFLMGFLTTTISTYLLIKELSR